MKKIPAIAKATKTTIASARSVKVSPGTYEKLQRIIQQATREGWQSLDVKRDDRPTMSTVVDVAADRLLRTDR